MSSEGHNPIGSEFIPAPVAIGGIGGSGTRVVAMILQSLGYYIGSELNRELDNLWYTLLFKDLRALDSPNRQFQRRVGVFVKAMQHGSGLGFRERLLIRHCSNSDRPGIPRSWLKQWAGTLRDAASQSRRDWPWGWKEPNTHVFCDRLAQMLPGMHYVHVVRNGLDMAFSDNHQQVNFWGRHFLDRDCSLVTPGLQLKYWCAVQQRIFSLRDQGVFPILVVPFDQLVHRPQEWIKKMAYFAGAEATTPLIEELADGIKVPASTGRFRQNSLNELDAADIEYVASLGFATR